jgi:hypothetical protein
MDNTMEAANMDKRTPEQIANHILFNCEGDHCLCCDWSEEDRAALEAMTLEQAQDIIYNREGEDEDRPSTFDYMEREENMTDMEADADALASAGWGTDEDYGYFGDEG